MKPTTAEELASRAEDLQLLAPGDLHAVWADVGGRNVPIEALGAALLRHELLTSYQLERLLRGDRKGFFYGAAKILYQVGAGSFARNSTPAADATTMSSAQLSRATDGAKRDDKEPS